MGNHSHEMAGKLCIVTGGNTGIGKETARALAGLGATVVLACRDLAKAQAARKEIWASVPDAQIEVMRLDLGDTSQIDVFASAFAERHQRLDVLINNAGVSTRRRTTTKDGFETVFGVNHVGPARLTLKLLDVLKKSAPSRVIFVASNYHFQGHMEWNDLQFEERSFGAAAYKQSKLANVLFTKALARRLAGSGVTVNALHPGVVATELGREHGALFSVLKLFMMSPRKGAECTLYVATAPELTLVTGEYFDKSKPRTASSEACDEAAQEQLWAITQRLIGNGHTSLKIKDS